MLKQLSLYALCISVALPAFGGVSISLNIPEPLIPTEKSEVNNPVSLEASDFFIPDGYLQGDETLDYVGNQWFFTQWDDFVGDYTKIVTLPFNFPLLGQSYNQIQVSRQGYINLLPTDYNGSYVRSVDSLRTDGWTSVNNSFFQGLDYPSIFALAKNNSYNGNWWFELKTSDAIENHHIKTSHMQALEDRFIIYNQVDLVRSYDRFEEAPDPEHYTLEQAIVLHQNGDIELHFDTNAPIAEMVADLTPNEAEFSQISERFYSGMVIPETVVQGAGFPLAGSGWALPFVTHITSGGAHSYLLSAQSLNNLTTEDIPDDGSPVLAGAPALMADNSIHTLERPITYATQSNGPLITLKQSLPQNSDIHWSVREVMDYSYQAKDQQFNNVLYSEWSEMSEFHVLENEDSDSGLGTFPLSLLALSSLLLVRRKSK